MSPEEQRNLKKLLLVTAEYYSKNISNDALAMMAGDLDGFSFKAVCEAIGKYRHNQANRQFPLPAHLIELIRGRPHTERESAVAVTERILGAIAKYDYTWPIWLPVTRYETGSFEGDFAKVLGSTAIRAVRLIGGWAEVCNQARTGEPGVFRAQLREIVQACAVTERTENFEGEFLEHQNQSKQIGFIDTI